MTPPGIEPGPRHGDGCILELITKLIILETNSSVELKMLYAFHLQNLEYAVLKLSPSIP